MTGPERSKLRSKSNSGENLSQAKLKIRATKSKSKSKSKSKVPLSPEHPISNISEIDQQNLVILGPDFCSVDALDLAPLLLGKYLRRDDVILQITEVRFHLLLMLHANCSTKLPNKLELELHNQ